MHVDNYSVMAAMSLPIMLDTLDSASLTKEETEVSQLLKDWDYVYSAQGAAPIYFEAWTRELFSLIWDEFDHDSLVMALPTDYNTIYLMKNDQENLFFDNASTPEIETLPQLINQSFKKSLEVVSQWKEENESELNWPKYRGAQVVHLLRLDPFNSSILNSGGHADAINSIKYNNHGPSQRMVVELGKEVKAWTIYPGGQSGNPGSYYYDNLIPMYEKGEYFEALFMKNPDANPDQIIFTQVLNPVEK